MSSPLYQQLNPQGNVLSMIQEFKNDPMSVVRRRFNLPEGVNNPNEIIQHLLSTGQITQGQVNQAMQMMNNPQLRDLLK